MMRLACLSLLFLAACGKPEAETETPAGTSSGSGSVTPESELEITQPMPMGLLASKKLLGETLAAIGPSTPALALFDFEALADSVLDTGKGPGDLRPALVEARSLVPARATGELLKAARGVSTLLDALVLPDGFFGGKDPAIPIVAGRGARTFKLDAETFARAEIDLGRAEYPYAFELLRAEGERLRRILRVDYRAVGDTVSARIERSERAEDGTADDWARLDLDGAAGTLTTQLARTPPAPRAPVATILELRIDRTRPLDFVSGGYLWGEGLPSAVAAAVALPRFAAVEKGDVEAFASVLQRGGVYRSAQVLSLFPTPSAASLLVDAASMDRAALVVDARRFLTGLLREPSVNSGCADLGQRLRAAVASPPAALVLAGDDFCRGGSVGDDTIFAAAAAACDAKVAIALDLKTNDGATRTFYWCNKLFELLFLTPPQHLVNELGADGSFVRRIAAPDDAADAELDSALATRAALDLRGLGDLAAPHAVPYRDRADVAAAEGKP